MGSRATTEAHPAKNVAAHSYRDAMRLCCFGAMRFNGTVRCGGKLSGMDIRFAYIPCKDAAEANTIGRALIEEKLAACCNIIDSMSSIYKWEGELKQESEALLIAKTQSSHTENLTARVRELHSYDTPCIATFAPASLNPEYLRWLESQTL